MPRGDPRWGEVLQLPNVNLDLGGADRAKQMWLARQGEMGGAQATALAELTAALKAQRDAKMAELEAANAGRGGGGGGRGGGGGGSTTPTYTPYDNTYNPWLDDYMQTMGQTTPPPTPSIDELYKKGNYPSYKNTLPKPSATATRSGRGFKPPKPKVATRYRTILS